MSEIIFMKMIVEYSALIVDNDIWMQRILSKALQSYGFTKTILASNGFEGIALAVEHQPNIIILDILMPEMSGHLTLKVLKKIHLTKYIPVIMVSALSDSENLRLAVKYGSVGIISKPFTQTTIYEKLLSIFGKENLDRIAKNEPILNEYEYNDNLNTDDEENSSFYDTANLELTSENDASTNDNSSPALNIPHEQFIQNYKQDEKSNIESIKKLLVKIKK